MISARSACLAAAVAVSASLSTGIAAQQWPEPTDTPLGTPSISIASGTDLLIAGVGLEASSIGTVSIDVPAGARVAQVLAYWEGHDILGTEHGAADTVHVGTAPACDIPIVGTALGGTHFFFANAYSTVYRADITDLGLVQNGSNDICVTGLDYTAANNGFGILVVLDDGSRRTIDMRDGNDLAHFRFQQPVDQTTPVVFDFPAATTDRVATFSYLVASVDDRRTSVIEIRDGDGNLLLEDADALGDTAGPGYDAYQNTVTIPAGVDEVSVQILSKDAQTGRYAYLFPASLGWIASGLALDKPAEPCIPLALRLRYTGEDCSVSSHTQSGGSVSCSGDPAFANYVVILASDSPRPFARGSRILACRVVALGGEFTIRSRHRGLPPTTYIHIMDCRRQVLQTVSFDTSGNEPIATGNQFGGVLVTGLVCKSKRGICAKKIRPCWKKRRGQSRSDRNDRGRGSRGWGSRGWGSRGRGSRGWGRRGWR